MKITAVVPVWNEKEEVLAGVIQDLQGFVDEIIVVNDGSLEDVEESMKKMLCKRYDKETVNCKLEIGKNLYFLRHKINRGQGAALQTGTDFAIARGADIIVHFDSDGQHQAKDIPGMVEPIINGEVEFVFGSKVMGGNYNTPWLKKFIIMPVARLIDYIFTGIKLTDVHPGFRAFHRDVADKVYLSQDRMAHASEYPMLVGKHKIRYREVPVEVVYHDFGQGISGGFKILRELLFGKIVK